MYDVIVVGAGPTGATTAKALADSHLKVLLVERMKMPRYKSCSGVLIKKSIDLVSRYFGKDVPRSAMCTPTDNRGMIFTDDKGKEYAFEQEGVNIWRSSFDNWLTENAVEAGVELRDKTSVISCEQKSNHIELKLHSDKIYTEQARYVIDCEGVTSVLKRSVLKISPKFITTYQTFNYGKIDLDPHYFYAYLQPELSEYDSWFNVKDNMLVLGVAVKDTGRIAFFYDSFIRYMQNRHALTIVKTVKEEKWLMPYIRAGCNIDYGEGRLLFAGEVAGFLNPMGEGISAGMESGNAAALAIAEHFDEPDRVPTDYRDRTKMLKTYMERQWHFVTSMAESFKMG